jgi:hypothetical protein
MYQQQDRSRDVELPGPFTSAALQIHIVGDTAGALPMSELDTKLAVAGEQIVRCATSKPARALVRVDIQDSQFVDAEVASGLGVNRACVRAALVGRSLFRDKMNAALVLDVAWRAVR